MYAYAFAQLPKCQAIDFSFERFSSANSVHFAGKMHFTSSVVVLRAFFVHWRASAQPLCVCPFREERCNLRGRGAILGHWPTEPTLNAEAAFKLRSAGKKGVGFTVVAVRLRRIVAAVVVVANLMVAPSIDRLHTNHAPNSHQTLITF